MNIFTRLLLLKKDLKVSSIPNELLKFKSSKCELDNVTFYYLENGLKILSVLEENNNKTLDVIKILNSLNQYFHFSYDNLFIRKEDEIILGFSYPLEYEKSKLKNKKVNLEELINVILEENEPENLESYLLQKDSYKYGNPKSLLINTIFLYKVLKYLNKNNISVKKLTLNDIKKYNQSDEKAYIYIQNAIRKLDILNEGELFEENLEIINLCIEYFQYVCVDSGYNFSFTNFIKDFKCRYEKIKNGTWDDATIEYINQIDFVKIFYEQFERMVVFECEHEYDKNFLRCPICRENSLSKGNYKNQDYKDIVVSSNERRVFFNKKNLVLSEKDLKVYSSLLTSNIHFLLDKEILTAEYKNCILRFLQTKNTSAYHYSLLYDNNNEFIGISIDSHVNSNETRYEDLEKNLRVTFDEYKLRNKPYLFHQRFVGMLQSMINRLSELHEKELTLNLPENYTYKDILNCFFIIKSIQGNDWYCSVDVKPTCLKDLKNEINSNDFIAQCACSILFNLYQTEFNSRVEDNKLISDKFDLINLLNLQIVSEYKKFLKGTKYDANIVCNIIKNIIDSTEYDESYIVSPLKFKSVLNTDINKEELKEQYEFISKKINDSVKLEWLYDRKDKINMILPEYIVYGKKNGEIVYKGYWIKKIEKHYVSDVFKNQEMNKFDNKQIIKMLIAYYNMLRSATKVIKETPVEYFCFDSTFSNLVVCYRPSGSKTRKVISFLYDNILEMLKNSNLYLSDAISIIENPNLTALAEKKLIAIYESFTNYCDVHKSWYENNLSKCPICSIYYEYINISSFIDKRKKIFENQYYTLYEYKTNIHLKLYKISNDLTLCNGKSIIELEDEVLITLKNKVQIKNSQKIIKLVKDSKAENVIGVLVAPNDNSKSVFDVLNNIESTNLTNLKICIELVENIKNMISIFEILSIGVKKEINEFFKYHLFYSESLNTLFISDLEIIKNLNKMKGNITLKSLYNLDKIIKTILSYNDKCYDFQSIEFPKIDDNYIINITKILEDLLKYYTQKTAKLCDKHNVYYNTVDGMCPICVKEMEDYWIFAKEDRGRQINVGGEALIYTLGLSSLVKTYTKGNINKNQTSNNVEELRKMLDEHFEKKMKEKENLLKIMRKFYTSTKEDLKNKNFIIVFPKKLFYGFKNKTFFGFVQDKVLGAVSLSIFTNKNKCNELGFTTHESLLEILIGYGEGIEYLHNSSEIRKIVPEGIVLGDVSGRNALYSKENKKVAIIDMDSVGINEYPCYTYTEDYIDPLIKQKSYPENHLTFESDWYSYAIICFYILTKVHPFEGNYSAGYGQRMSIVERKDKKISVVGKYKNDIVLPNVVDEWSWMPNYLLNAFVDIFENEERFSIVDLLKKTYNEITGSNKYIINNVTSMDLSCNTKRYVGESTKAEVIENEKEEKGIEIETLATLLANGINLYSTDLIISNGYTYYKNISEKNILGDETIFFEKINYKSQNELLEKASNYDFRDVFVRDGKGIATIVEEGKKFIGLIDNFVFTKIYRISDSKRNFKILYDSINCKYLLISINDEKSYVVFEDKKVICDYSSMYNVDIKALEIFKEFTFETKVAYVGNAIYYAKDGAISRLDLVTGNEQEIECMVSTRFSAVKIFQDTIILSIVDKEHGEDKIVRLKFIK